MKLNISDYALDVKEETEGATSHMFLYFYIEIDIDLFSRLPLIHVYST
jgi:hypothetical protein